MRYVLIVVALLAVGCSDSPTAPTPPPVAACQSQNTANLAFENRSTGSFTFDVYVDRALFQTIGPTQTSRTRSVVAGVQHTVQFYVTNTSFVACVVTPIPIACSQTSYFCTF